MGNSKHFDKIALAVTAIALVVVILFTNGASLGIQAKEKTLGYEQRLFDNTKVHTIDIVMDDWDSFIKNAPNEEYTLCSLVIDGESKRNVAIRGKGNTSLSNVSSMGSSRYSFKIEFDHYDDSNTYYGLDKLSLNNIIQDNTYMKDYLVYTLMNEFDASSPLCSFVNITVNGESWGLYLAVEGIEDSFLERNYSDLSGELYKPDSLSFGGGRGNGKDFSMDNFNMEDFNGGNFNPQAFNMSVGGEDKESRKDFGGGFNMGGFGMGSNDVKLQYIDDNLESYSNIWNNAKTDITTEDQYRLIDSLKRLSQNEDIENTVDVENVIRYFVVHNFVCNGDSYTGSMVHNYYLYEKDGVLSMLPWDYNLAFGTFTGGEATSTVNTPIDTPVSGGSQDRPMLNWIFENEKYTKIYHEYFKEFLETVNIDKIIDDAYNLIASYVESDPTKFCTYEEFEKGVETLKEFCALRKESISLQLQNNQTTENQSYVDASHLTLSDMGSMGGGMGGGMQMPNGGDFQMPDGDFQMPEGDFQMPEGDFQMPEGGMQIPNGDFQMPEGGMQMPPGGFGGRNPFS